MLCAETWAISFSSDDMVRDDASSDNRPIPLIDPEHCTGCGLCIKACPTGALAMQGSVAVVARQDACEYHGLCEMICPADAISRPFEIVCVDEGDEEIGVEDVPTKVGDSRTYRH
jgi:Pyruvate/2-oxoacid:ferredoxin oxidoreductase delta subunit